MSTLQKRLQELMSKKIGANGRPVTANQVSKGAKVPQSTMSRILNDGVEDVRTKNLEKLAHYFGVTVAHLRGHDNSSPMIQGSVPNGQPQAAVTENLNDLGGARQLVYVTMPEIELLTAYRSSNEIGRKAIVAAVTALATQEPSERRSNVVEIGAKHSPR